MSHHVIEYDCLCESCSGTGLYVGFAEKDGFAVVCHYCKGTGERHNKIEYDDFEERVERNDIKRVVQANPGIGLGVGKVDGKTLTYESFGGLSYEDWKNGKGFKIGTEMREYSCPAWWYQGADYRIKPNWDECISMGSFSSCFCFKNKNKCWERFDKQFKLQESKRIDTIDVVPTGEKLQELKKELLNEE